MTPADGLLAALKDEEAVLHERRFEGLADIQRRKDECLSQMEGFNDAVMLDRIREQAGRNERLMSIALTAIRGLKSRFANIGQSNSAVGYGRDGSPVAVSGGNTERRV